jgi:hypothetical protein
MTINKEDISTLAEVLHDLTIISEEKLAKSEDNNFMETLVKILILIKNPTNIEKAL